MIGYSRPHREGKGLAAPLSPGHWPLGPKAPQWYMANAGLTTCRLLTFVNKIVNHGKIKAPA